ncbi:MAG: hypothetical protein ACE5HE_10885 [Phycisphaerae bacterium]
MAVLRLSDIRASRIPKILGYCSTSSEVAAYVNEAQQRLMEKGSWWGCIRRYAICVTDGYITWPRHVAAIEVIAMCNEPIRVRDQYFEFLETGLGIQTRECGNLQALDRNPSPIHTDILGVDKKIKVTADVAETAGKQVLIKGLDANGNPVRTGTIDGEYVNIDNAAPAISTNIFAAPGPVEVHLPGDLNGRVRLYSYDPATTDEILIATYDPDETVPMYRRSLIAGLETSCTSCGDSDTDCSDVRIIAMCRMEHIPVVNNTDVMIIQNLEALTHTCQALRYEEMDSMGANRKADAHMAKAIVALEEQLEHYQGAGTVVPIRFEGKTWGAGDIANIY